MPKAKSPFKIKDQILANPHYRLICAVMSFTSFDCPACKQANWRFNLLDGYMNSAGGECYVCMHGLLLLGLSFCSIKSICFRRSCSLQCLQW